ncbi:MAG: hypothetical protein ABI182_05465 [Candidatus Baltobacteraceae bacterium]
MQFDGPPPTEDEIAALSAVFALSTRPDLVLQTPQIPLWRLAMRYPELELEDLRGV